SPCGTRSPSWSASPPSWSAAPWPCCAYGAVADANRAQFRLYRALGQPAQLLLEDPRCGAKALPPDQPAPPGGPERALLPEQEGGAGSARPQMITGPGPR